MKEFYKMRLTDSKDGLMVITDVFVSIHETPCFYYCVRADAKGFFNSALMRDGETKLQYAKRKNIKVRIIHKHGSRIAFETEKQALEHLQMLKRKQIQHMRRQIEFNSVFLDKCKSVGDLNNVYSSDICKHRVIPFTDDLCKGYFLYD